MADHRTTDKNLMDVITHLGTTLIQVAVAMQDPSLPRERSHNPQEQTPMSRPTMSLSDVQVEPNFKKAATTSKIGPKESQTRALRQTVSLKSITPLADDKQSAHKPAPAKKAKEPKMSAKKKAAAPKKAVAKKAAKKASPRRAKKAKAARTPARKPLQATAAAPAGDKEKKIDKLIKLLNGAWCSTERLEAELGWVNNTLRSIISNLQQPVGEKGGRGLTIQRMRLEGKTYYGIDPQPQP